MIGERMRQARLAAGLTLDAVNVRLGDLGQPITKARLSKYERGGSVPSAAFLLRLAEVLGVRSADFLRKPATSVEWLAVGKYSRLTKSSQERLKAAARNVIEGQLWLQLILYPDEETCFPEPRCVRSLEDAEITARTLREVWGLGDLPIASVVQLLEDRGGVVVAWAEPERRFDGVSGWADAKIPVMVINANASDNQRRYNLAHELGHLMMRSGDLPESDQEQLAHRFAAAFLAPAETVRHELGPRRRRLTLDELGLMQRRYGLSMQAWTRRALDLEIIEPGHYHSLRAEFAARGWRKAEPEVFQGQEEPTRLRQMTLRALAEGIITEERARQLCRDALGSASTSLEPRGDALDARELMQLPPSERGRILAAAAASAEKHYRTDPALTDFEAFGEEDLFDATPEG